MIKLIKWTERQFDFNMPETMFPAIIARLCGSPARIEEIAKSITPGTLLKKTDDSWSVQENIGHLYDIDELNLLRLQEYIDKKDELSPADMSNRKTYEAGYNSQNIDDILAMLRKRRSEYVFQLENVDEEIITRYSYHPRLKLPMRLIDHAYFAAEHDDHHIAIIRNIISQI